MMYRITSVNDSRFISVKSIFKDKETGEEKEFFSKYKIANGVETATIEAWLDGQNPDFINKNIKEQLLPQGIVTDAGNKKLLADMLSQME